MVLAPARFICLSFPLSERREDDEEEARRNERTRGKERGRENTIGSEGEATTRDQSDTKSTDVRSLHGRTNARDAYEHSLARPRAPSMRATRL